MLSFAFFNLVFNSLRLLLSSFSFEKPVPSGKNNDVSSFLTELKKNASYLFVLLSQIPKNPVSIAMANKEIAE